VVRGSYKCRTKRLALTPLSIVKGNGEREIFLNDVHSIATIP